MAEREYSFSITASADSIKAAFAAANAASQEFIAGVKDGFGQGLRDAVVKGTAQVEKFGDETQKTATKAISSFDSIALKITGLVAGLDLAGKAMSAIGGAIAGVFEGINRGGELNDLSQRLGVAVETLSSLELGASTAGVSVEGMATGIQQLSRNMVEAASGSKEAQAGFAALGISVTDSGGKLKSTEEILLAISDRFAGAEDGAAKTGLAMQLLGRSGAQLIPFLNEGAAGLQKWQQLSSDLGLTLTTELAASMDEIGDSVLVFQSAFAGAQNQLAIGMAPALTAVSSAAVELVKNLGIADGGIRDFGSAIGEAVVDGTRAALGALNTFVEAVYSLGIGPALAAYFGAAFQGVADLALSYGKLIGANLVEAFAVTVDSALRLVPGVGLLVQAFEPFQAAAGVLKSSAKEAVDGAIAEFARLGQASPQLANLSAGLEAAIGELDKFDPSIQRNDAHVQAWKTSLQGAATPLPVIAKGATDAAGAVEKLRDRFAEQIRTQTEAIAKTEAQNSALEQAIAQNLSAEEAQALLNETTGQFAASAALATNATEAEAAALGRLAVSAAEAAARNRELNATRNAQTQTQFLLQEKAILDQVIAGTKDRAVAEREIAVLQQQQKGVALEQAEAYVAAQEGVEGLRDRVKAMDEDVIHLGDVFKDSFNQAFDAVIDGTRDMGDVLEGIGIGIGKRFFSAMLDSKLKDFDPTVKANFLDLGEFGKSVFGDLFSGGGGSGSSGSFLGQAADWIGGFFGGGAAGGSATGLDPTSLLAAGFSPQQIAELQKGFATPTGGAAGGFSFGDAAGGAISGYGTASLLGGMLLTDTNLPGSLTQVEGQAIHRIQKINEVVGAILGAILSIWLGPLGGVVGGAVSSLVGTTWTDRVDRDALRNRDFTGGHGAWNMPILSGNFNGAWDLAAMIDPVIAGVMWSILGLPTLGTAFRRAGEGIIDASQTFGGEDGKGGLQALLGDFTRSGASNQRGPEIALERGLTQAQVDAIMGSTGSIFSQLAEGELPEDAGRFAEAMGRTMAEFLSRGLAEGMDYDDMLASLAAFAQETGVTALSSIENLNAQLEQSKAAGIEFGKLDPTAAATQGAEAYAASLYGISEVFSSTLPLGVNIAQLALQTMEKDGVKAFENLDHTGQETLTNLTKDAELFQDVVAHLVEQGFTIDTEEFETRLAAITDSAQFLGENFGSFFQFENVGVGVQAVMENLKTTVLGTYQEIASKQLFEGTNFAAAFEPVFAALNRIEEFDLTTATGSQGFMDLLLPALAQGKANLQEYIPILQLMADNWKEIEKIIDEAMKPDDAEKAAIAVEQVFSGLGGILEASLSEGVAVLANGGTYQQALDVFKGTFATGVEAALKQAAFNAMVDTVVLQPLIQKWQPALSYVMAAGMANGFDDPMVREAWRIVLQGLGADAEALAPLIFDARLELEDGDAVMRGFFTSLQASIDSIGQSLAGGISSLIRESIDIGIEDGLRAGQKHFAENIGEVMYDVLLDAIVRAFVDSVLVEGILGDAMAQGAALYAAAVDEESPGGRFITPEEQAGINEWRDYFREVYGIAREEAISFGNWLIEEGITLPNAEGGNPHEGYVTSRRPIEDVDLIDIDGRRGRSFPASGFDPETEGRRVVEETVKPPAEALADLIDTRVIPGLSDFTDAVREAAGALSSLEGGGDGGGTTTGGGRSFPGGRTLDGAAAMGGMFGPGSTFLVGEQGPEVVVYGEDGSMQVIPIDHATMQSLLDGGVPGYARGTDRPGIGDFRNGRGPTRTPGGGGGGPGLGAPITSPLDPRHPDYVDPRDKPTAGEDELDILVRFNFDNAIEDFARGGTAEDLKEALKTASGEGLLEGMMNAVIESLAFEEFNQKLSDAIRDGKTPDELAKMAEEFAAGAEQAILAMGPAFDVVAEAFGLTIEEEVIDALATAAATAGDLIGSSLRSALRDPANLTFETFSLSLRQAVYGNIVDGLVDAFIDAGVIQGALAPMLAIITAEFGNLGIAIAAGSAEGIAAASAIILAEIGKIAGIIDDPAFKAAIQSLLDLGKGIADGLGLSLKNTTATIDNTTDSFNSAADAAANACTGECDLEQKLVTTDEKIATLDSYGRTGGISDRYYEDVKRATGTSDSDSADFDDGDDRYGFTGSDADWRRSQRWQRRDRRDDEDPGYYGPLAASRGRQEESSEIVRELRELRKDVRAEREQLLHAEIKIGEDAFIDAHISAKRVAQKAGIPF